ncbi:VacJ family lipoprotein [Ramlibacter sp. USB13]|uniref:VacJ family lipoprotein n=1 Tax=Ramlibacter cellulosilyticus TaxID=2764187 RepID=A0A923MS89_9BURK|nr:VacJ family lipoprotein [Ramlibacter cellulosilyticus]MBC5784535.1 VacJ family lipoprotein [Ramlibacter cellulosilyticus]
MKTPRSATRTFAVLALAGALAGCASTPKSNPRDPLEPLNRQTHKFNEGVDNVVLKPVATLYREKVPPLVRTGVSNFFGNLGDAWSAVNSLLQFRLQDAEENFARFHLNTMFGVFGVFDIASDVNIERHREDFGQTLGRWGVPAGPYIVLPLLGPSTLRDTVALPVDWKADLLSEVRPIDVRNVTYGVRAVDTRSNLLRVSSVLEEAALDKYSFTRDAYLQRRRAEVYDQTEDGEVPPGLPKLQILRRDDGKGQDGDPNAGKLPPVDDEPPKAPPAR